MKLNYELYLSCSMGAAAAEPVGVQPRSGIGTRWLVAVELAGRGRHGHPGGVFPTVCTRLKQQSGHVMSTFFRLSLSSF